MTFEPLMLVVLAVLFVGLLLLAVPIAVVIAIASAATLLLSVAPVAALTTLAQRVATGLDSFSLLAIPFFILAGQVMNRGGMARRLVDLGKSMVGGLPGGLAFVNILACMLFGFTVAEIVNSPTAPANVAGWPALGGATTSTDGGAACTTSVRESATKSSSLWSKRRRRSRRVG